MELDTDFVYKNVRALYEEGLYESAETLGTFLLSNSKPPGPSADALELFADCLFAQDDWARATTYYQKAVVQWRSRQPPSVQRPKDEARVRFKLVKSLLKQGDSRQAYPMLESIPQASRTMAMSTMLAEHYRAVGNDRAAVTCFKDVLKQNPFALEAIVALLELGESAADLRPLYVNTPHHAWLEQIISAHSMQAQFHFANAAASFAALEKKYPNNLHILENEARCELQLPSGAEQAKRTFERMRSVDAQCVHSLDVYASLLRLHSPAADLNRLSHDLLRCNARRPEPWLATAFYAEQQGQKDKALEYVDRALELRERHVMALLLKGNLLLQKNSPDAAAALFRRAFAVRKDLASFSGLARCHLMAGRVKDALTTAADARRVLHQSPGATALVGLVMSHIPDKRKQARQFFDEALRLDRRNAEAVQGLVQLHVAEDRFQDAEKLLREQIQLQMRDVYVARLADVLVMIGPDKHDEALALYATALALNPQCEVARIGKDRLEKIMKGEDPDADEDAEPAEDDDVEFQEEAEEEEAEDEEDDAE